MHRSKAVSLEKALADAYAQRPDYLAAQARLEATDALQKAATANLLPTLSLDADYGTIGQTVSDAHPTYTIAANVRIPIFEGRRTQGRQLEAEAAARQRRAEYEDLRGRIDMRCPHRVPGSRRRQSAARSGQDDGVAGEPGADAGPRSLFGRASLAISR